ncbi:N-acetyltransferase [Massilia sp. HP4]|uniref:N-acyl amino acid synthase FeeM domain-containing protein n=1 Tax=Massilia sp. HP4 TaxID=2562316 RepID=UPI001E2F198E|nr:N-acetyltransferase [Massilia sp. HP4]
MTSQEQENSEAFPADSLLNSRASEEQDKMTASDIEDVIVNQDSFGIRLLDTTEGRNSASMLINKMYAWRGYAGTHQTGDDPNRIVLTATDKGDVVGTLSLGMDSEVGLMADEIFKSELDALRQQGAKLSEFTKLAFDPSVRSKASLANLFHLAVIYARDVHGCSDIIIEVNPRHRGFYKRMLGFEQIGELKTNPRVNAPAYLMRVRLAYATEQILKHGGTFGSDASNRSFYPFFFSPREESGIVARLLRMEHDHAD